MILGIDIDDTIACTSHQGNIYIKEMFPDCTDYHNLPLNDYYKFINKYADKIRTNEPLMDGVKEAFLYFKEKNIKVVFITARNNAWSPNTEMVTKKYLEKYGLEYSKIIFDKELKGSAAKEENVSLFIDDKEENLDDISKYGIECIRITNDKNSKYKTFDNWKDILDYIKRKVG